MVRIHPLKAEHLGKLKMQRAQDYVSAWLTPDVKQNLEQGMSFAVVDGDEVLACGGVLEYWSGRAVAWAMLADGIGARFMRIHRAVVSFLDSCDYRRIEATADVTFCNAHAWLKLLGFTLETPRLVGYLPDGTDVAMYVRIK